MVLKSIPIDDMNTVVFAIRGSQTFMDWAVNFRPAPSSPEGFLVRNSPFFFELFADNLRTTLEISAILASYTLRDR
jgi:hypothetical protein